MVSIGQAPEFASGLTGILSDQFQRWNKELNGLGRDTLIPRLATVARDFKNCCSTIPPFSQPYGAKNPAASSAILLCDCIAKYIFSDPDLVSAADQCIQSTFRDARLRVDGVDFAPVQSAIELYYDFSDAGAFRSFSAGFLDGMRAFYEAF
jgi:hypothetical protein